MRKDELKSKILLASEATLAIIEIINQLEETPFKNSILLKVAANEKIQAFFNRLEDDYGEELNNEGFPHSENN